MFFPCFSAFVVELSFCWLEWKVSIFLMSGPFLGFLVEPCSEWYLTFGVWFGMLASFSHWGHSLGLVDVVLGDLVALSLGCLLLFEMS